MASGDLRFDGRVALVTGAGAGLGRAYARLLASRGAAVVVNDLGGSATGEGGSSRPADRVVEEIQAAGGKAVANYDSVEEGEKLVMTAVKTFGRIDIVINNAGILRDRSFARISDNDWDIIHRVHLRGSFLVSRAAWPHMKKQNYGRIIMTTSAAGLYGNFGQANYSAAKLGLLGLSNTLALEGAKNNIICNTIAPMAGSRLTETVWPQEIVDNIKPEYVAPLVAFLCHETCTHTRGCFEVGGGWMAEVRLQRAKGAVALKKGVEFTPEAVRDNWSTVVDFSDATYPTSSRDSFNSVMHGLESAMAQSESASASGGQGFDIAKALSWRPEPFVFTYNHKDVILYALSVGCGVSEKDRSELKFLYEGHEQFSALPTYAVIPAQMATVGFGSAMAGLDLDLSRLLHGEQYLELHQPLPTSGTLTCRTQIRDILDKGKGTVFVLDVDCVDEQQRPVVTAQFVLFFVGASVPGALRKSDHLKPTIAPPNRQPDAVLTEKTGDSQAAIYRLNGDFNPLHIDPDFAAMGGFSTPILHGLCSLGYAMRHVLRQFCGNDTSVVRALKVRFAKPVLPGQTLRTEMWKEGTRIHFRCSVVENGNVVLAGAYVDLDPSKLPTGSGQPSSSASNSGLKAEPLFEAMSTRIASEPNLVKRVKAVFLWSIKKDGKVAGQWTVDLKNGNGSISRGAPSGKADCSLTISDDDFVELVTGKLNPQSAFLKGRLKISGNIMLSQKLQALFNDRAKL